MRELIKEVINRIGKAYDRGGFCLFDEYRIRVEEELVTEYPARKKEIGLLLDNIKKVLAERNSSSGTRLFGFGNCFISELEQILNEELNTPVQAT